MRFTYLRDPLFLGCVALYFANRWVIKPLLPHGFFHTSLNDVICIPFWVPIMLWLMRRTGIRKHDGPPEWYEVLIPVALWSWVFEVYLPHVPAFRHLATADPFDVLCYTTGALISALFWDWRYRATSVRSTMAGTADASVAE